MASRGRLLLYKQPVYLLFCELGPNLFSRLESESKGNKASDNGAELSPKEHTNCSLRAFVTHSPTSLEPLNVNFIAL